MKGHAFWRNPAQVTGIILLLAAGVMFFIHPLLAAVVALIYIGLCVAACFFPQSNFLLRVTSRGNTRKNLVALTFDDGPSDPLTNKILDLLDKHSVKATFFISGINASRHLYIIREIISRGHSIGNHSFHHNPFLMLKGYRSLYREIADTQKILQKNGIHTNIFRPPVGIVNPKLAPILEHLGMFCVTFSCRAFDAGNRRIKNLGSRILKKVQADDIILLHDVPPKKCEDGAELLTEIEIILDGIRSKGLRIVPLAELINRQIMKME